MKIISRLLNIDRRVMYGLLALIILLLLIYPISQPLVVTPAVQGVYNAVEAIPPDKIAIVSVVWSSSTIAENGPQTEAIMRHLFRRNIKFALVAWDQQGNKLALDIAQRLSRELGKTYGVDWCSWGYRVPYLFQILPALAKDIPGTMSRDTFGTKIADVPMMRGVRNIHDVGLVAEITPSGTLEIWIGLIHGVYGTPIVYAPTLVMAPEAYNPLDARQIAGMLPGMIGAGEYEKLLNYRGFGQIGSAALSGSHLLIIILIILGNAGLVASKIAARSGSGGRSR